MKRLVIIGAGGHGRAVAEAVAESGAHEVVGFLDDGRSSSVAGIAVLGDTRALEVLRGAADCVLVAIGNNAVREQLHGRVSAVGIALATVIDRRAIVSRSARIAPGCAIMAGAIVGSEAELGEGAIVNIGGAVDHHCRIEPFGHVGTNASMAGGSVLGRGAWIQAGAALGYGVEIRPGEVLAPGEARAAGNRT